MARNSEDIRREAKKRKIPIIKNTDLIYLGILFAIEDLVSKK